MLQRYTEEPVDTYLDRVHISYIFEVEELDQVTEMIVEDSDSDVKLIVIDNIANFFRSYEKSQIDERITAIKYCGMLLRKLARKCNVPIILNNHLTTRYRIRDRPESGLEFVPYLGDTWTLMLDYRIRVDYLPIKEPGIRRAYLSHSTFSVPPRHLQPFDFKIEV